MRKPVTSSRARSTGLGPRIRDLYGAFDKLHTKLQAVSEIEGAGRKRWELLLNKCGEIAMKIAKTPATDVDEMLLKLRVTAWDIGDRKYGTLEELDHWQPGRLSQGAEFHALASLRDDVLRLQMGALGSGQDLAGWHRKFTSVRPHRRAA